MRTGTHHTPETRLAIRLKRLEKSMPPAEFARFQASSGALKWCPARKQLFPVAEFQKNRRSWDGLYSRGKACNAVAANRWHPGKAQDPEYREQKNQRTREWREANKGEKLSRASRIYHLKKHYGITLAILRRAVKYLEQDRRLNAAISERPKLASRWDSAVTTKGDAA